MQWRCTPPLQEVSGLLLTEASNCAAAYDDMLRRKTHFAKLQVSIGAGWLAVTLPMPLSEHVSRDQVLPRLAGATPLYHRLPGIWLPVGCEADVPAHVEPALVAAMLKHAGITSGAVVFPRLSTGQSTRAADIYTLEFAKAVEALEGRSPPNWSAHEHHN